MVYKRINNGSYNLHLIKTDKFKNIKIEIHFRNNIKKETLVKRSFLFDMLVESNELYKTKRDMILKCENLYNASLYSSIAKDGNMIFNSIQLSFLNPKYTKDKYLEEAIKLAFDIIFKPNINNNEFDQLTFNKIKYRYLNDIKNVSENPARLALLNALDMLNSKTSYRIMGKKEDIESITNSNLVDIFKDILVHDYIDVFVLGDFDDNLVIDYVSKYALFNTIKTHEIIPFVYNKKRNRIIKKQEYGDYNQSQVVCLLNYNNLTEYEKKYVAPIYNIILGGGSLDSKLYKKLREENSICYSVRSYYKKYDNIGYIMTSVDHDKIDLSIKLIKDSIKSMKNITDSELKNAISLVISSINMKLDIPEAIIDEYFFTYLNEIDPLDIRLDKFKNVSISDLNKLKNKISINYIYILGGNVYEKI